MKNNLRDSGSFPLTLTSSSVNSLNIHIKSVMCIYKIENVLNKHFYIGSAVNLRRRINRHLNLLSRNLKKDKNMIKGHIWKIIKRGKNET